VLGFALVRRRPALALGILWFFVWLGPTNSFLPRFDVANDRQLYIALIGPAWLSGLVCARMTRSGGARAAAAWAVIFAVAAALGAMTFARNRIYFTEVGFWEEVVSRAPHNARAHNNLGYAYALVCRRNEADTSFVRAARLDRSDYTAPINLSMLRDGSLPGYREKCIDEKERRAPGPPPERSSSE